MAETKLYIPDRLLKDAAKHGELVVFVGAGASMLCGSPDWRGFASQVVEELEKKGALSFLEAEQLKGLGDPRRTLSIVMAIAKEQHIAIDFDTILHPGDAREAGANLYKLLSDLRPVFVTTNYDKWLDDVGPGELSDEVKSGGESEAASRPSKRPKYYLREHLSSALLAERGAVIHLHGSYSVPSSMVVSLKDYIEHYADARVQAFLSTMFKNNTVLFIGYGLAELEVLDYVIRSNGALHDDSIEPRHFLLYAHRSTEIVQTKFIEKFFQEQCGVGVVPYCIDANGFQEVLEVIRSWGSELDVRDPTRLDLQKRLDDYVSAPSPVNRDAAIRLVTARPELSPYLVNALKDAVWFADLDRAGLFDVKYSPGVQKVEGEKGASYQADGWPALRYLEQVASSLKGEQAARLIEIVRAVSADAQERGLENWRTGWSLASIIADVPLEVLTDADIEMMKTWLDGRFDTSMVGYEVGKKLLQRLLESPDSPNWNKALLLVDALSMVRPVGVST